MTQPAAIETPGSDESPEPDGLIKNRKRADKIAQPSPLADPLLDVNDLIAGKVAGSRDGVHAAIKKGWIPEPIRWPNGRMFWRLSAIEDAVAQIEARAAND